MKLCSVEGCSFPSRSKGLCDVHRFRLRDRGTTDPFVRVSAVERFMKHVEKTETCWLWNGAVEKLKNGKGGYGRFQWNKKSWSAHRAAYILFVGPITEGLEVLHSCDVRNCVNPTHLHLGDPFMNQQECSSRGRRGKKRDHPNNPRFSKDQVFEIHDLFATGMSKMSLARRFQTSDSVIYGIVVGRAYKSFHAEWKEKYG